MMDKNDLASSCRLTERMVDVSKLRMFSKRVHSITQSSNISKPSTYDALMDARGVASGIVDNLDELLRLSKIIIDIQDGADSIDDKIMEDIRVWKSRSENVLTTILKILRETEATPSVLVTQGTS